MEQGKQRKLLGMLLTVVLIVLSLTACGTDEENPREETGSPQMSASVSDSKDSQPQESGESEETSKTAKSDGYEKFCQLKIGMTEGEVNAVLGEPARVDKAYYYYNVTVNGKDMELEVWINTTSGQVTYLRGNFEGEAYLSEFADSKTDLSAAGMLDSGELSSYEECTSAFRTPGYLIAVDEDGMTRYLWVDSDEGHMCITFKADGSIKSYVGLY